MDAIGDDARGPGPNADRPDQVSPHIPADLRDGYEIHSYGHAAAILASSFAEQWLDLQRAMREFRLSWRDIAMPGGNESAIPKILSGILRPCGWVEARIHADLHVHVEAGGQRAERVIPNYLDGHKIDYVKDRVAFDLEWNSKDQTFDRDLYALRTFHECGLVSVGVLMTRSASLNPLFEQIPALGKDGQVQKSSVKDKYGASTTWMGKLLYRLNAGRHGGCPLLVIGITPQQISDWPPVS